MPDDRILDERTRGEIPVEPNQSGPAWKRIFKNKKIIISSVLGLAIIGGIFWYFLSGTPAPNPTSTNVVLIMKGPDQLTSGNEAEYDITYRNGENADMDDVSLELSYPSGFTFKSSTPVATSSSGQEFNLPVVKQGGDGEVIIRGNLTGATGEDKEIQASLHYQLSNFNSEFAVQQSIHTSILPPNLTMDINGPVQVVNGQNTTFTVSLTNVSAQEFDNLAVQLTYPDGFSFTSSTPAAAQTNNYWTIAKLASNSSASIDITGIFTGDPSEDKLVRADLGTLINNTFAPQISSTATFSLTPSSLSLSVSAQPVSYVKLGDTINYSIKYGNQGNIGLSNLVITLNLDGVALDFTKVTAINAIVTGHTLTWKAATVPDLAELSPNQQGEVDFTIPVATALTTNLQNQIIKATAQIVSDEITTPTNAAELDLKLISSLNLSVTGKYISGAAPMQVGKSTLFGMTFTLTNLSNDLSDAVVTASLPLPSSAWNGVIIPDSEKSSLSYDAGSGIITWKIGALSAFTGNFSPALAVTFQLEVTPAASDENKDINLLSNIQASGTDTFVDQPLQTQVIDSVSTGSIDDSVLNSKGSTVQ